LNNDDWATVIIGVAVVMIGWATVMIGSDSEKNKKERPEKV